MVNINSFKTWADYVCNKVQSGNTETVPQFNENCFRSVMSVYEKDFQTFVQTGVASEFLKNYLVTNYVKQVNPNNTIISYPSNFEHLSSVGSYYNGKQYPAKKVNNTEWRDIIISTLMPATKRFPKYQEVENGIEFLPKNVGSVYLDYFRTPTQPIWGYTIGTNGRPIYNPLTSVNLDISEFSVNQVSAVYFSFRGVNLSDANIIAFSTAFKQESNSLL